MFNCYFAPVWFSRLGCTLTVVGEIFAMSVGSGRISCVWGKVPGSVAVVEALLDWLANFLRLHTGTTY